MPGLTLLILKTPAIGDVMEAANCTYDGSAAVSQGIGVKNDHEFRAIRALDHDMLVSHRDTGGHGFSHRRIDMRNRLAIQATKLARAEVALIEPAGIFRNIRKAPPKLSCAPVASDDKPSSVAHADPYGEKIEQALRKVEHMLINWGWQRS